MPSDSAVTTLDYATRAEPPPDPRTADLQVEAQAALRQFGIDRLVGYGVDQSDAHELHELVLSGQPWQQAATQLASTCTARAGSAPGDESDASRVGTLRRTAALVRMSQVMMLADTTQRRDLYALAASAFHMAAELAGDRRHVQIETPAGPVVGWLCPAAREKAVGSAVVIGGIEGYAMDFDTLGAALAARGIDALLLDGPGQGETRFADRHYLGTGWRDAYRSVLDYLDARAPGRPIGFIGNSMGGSIAMAVAATDPRVKACCDNGGIPAPWLVPPAIGTFFTKMVAFCGTDDPQRAVDIWSTVTPLAPGPNSGYPLLVVQGGLDPLVSNDMARTVLHNAPTDDKRLVVFSDGNHCIYNHRSDRDALIADWTRARLAGVDATDITC